MNISTKKTIFIVCGPICSGKDFFCDKILTNQEQRISISSIVKKITQSSTRIQDASLDVEISQHLIKQINQVLNFNQFVILEGIRQLSILTQIEESFKDLQFVYIWLQVPTNIREQRFNDRQDKKDQTLLFLEVDEKDQKLGLRELERYLKSKTETLIIKHH